MLIVKKTCLLVLFCAVLDPLFAADSKIVVAHRGASGYLPEHSMEAKVLAHGMGADYIEQDVVMTQDDALIVIHDLTLDRTTDVRARFPERAREDGLHYVVDFTLAELRTLRVMEGTRIDKNESIAIFPDRFSPGKGFFTLHTLAEEIELIQGLNQTTGREAGLYVEAKSPWFHHQEGKDLSRAILDVLKEYGYTSRTDRVYYQTFDFNELKRVRQQLLPAMEMDIRLVQLIAHNDWQETFEFRNGQWLPYDYAWMVEDKGMAEIARFANGVGPAMDMIVSSSSTIDNLIFTDLVSDAHQVGLVVHPFTFRRDAGQMPGYAQGFDSLLEIFYRAADVDGVFTDYPDLAVKFLQAQVTQ